MAEKYLTNDAKWWEGQGTINILNFNKITLLLDKNINLVYGLELPLWSHIYKTAGRTDCVCVWGEHNTILDFKTSRRNKVKEDILAYFLQTTVYARMFEEIYFKKIDQIVIMMLVDHEEPLIFIDDPKKYDQLVNDIFKGEGSV